MERLYTVDGVSSSAVPLVSWCPLASPAVSPAVACGLLWSPAVFRPTADCTENTDYDRRDVNESQVSVSSELDMRSTTVAASSVD